MEKVEVLTIDPADVAKLREALQNYGDVSIENFGQFTSELLAETNSLPEGDLPAILGKFTRQNTHITPGNLVKITPT